MARIAGVNIPTAKRVVIALTYIHGIGPKFAQEIMEKTGLPLDKRIPGIRPGERTAEYIDYVLTRITVVGAIYLVFVCILPEILVSQTGVPLSLGGTSLLIVVSVTLDTVAQIQGHLIAQQYEGLIKKSKLRGGKRGR